MDFFQWLREGYRYLFFFIAFFLIILILVFFTTYLKRFRGGKLELNNLLRDQKRQESQLKIREKKLENAQRQLMIDQKKNEAKEKKLQQEEKRISEFANQLFRKEELFTQQLTISSKREEDVRKEMEKINQIKRQLIDGLGKIIPISREEAKKSLLILLKEEVNKELERYKEEEIRRVERGIKEESSNLICLALEKCSSELIFTKMTDTLHVENQQIISKIIGREGRNINAFQRVTGTELIIDRESDELSIQISSFNSLRRAIALQTLRDLIKEARFSPLQIEKTYQKANSEVNEFIVKSGAEILKELEISNVHPELVKHLGKLKYRTSYGQNVLEHCLEVAKLAGSIAAELGLDVRLARRVGLFHDIGKAVEDGGNYSHVLSGISIAKKCQEPEAVINAIASHHRDFPPNNLYSLIILAADKLSAARPGARGYQLESYVERMNNLENIANEFPGIKKSYAFQAGREVWVLADSEKLSDHKTWEVARKIREKIKRDIIIPGEITIHVVREKIFIQKLNHKREKEKISPPKKKDNYKRTKTKLS